MQISNHRTEEKNAQDQLIKTEKKTSSWKEEVVWLLINDVNRAINFKEAVSTEDLEGEKFLDEKQIEEIK